MSAKLYIEKLSSGYGDLIIVRDITFYVNSGEAVVILGPNGSGKTTLLNTIIGLLECKKGKILHEIDGNQHDICKISTADRIKKGLALVPEGKMLFPHLTVRENLVVAAKAVGIKDITNKLKHVYEIFPRLRERENQRAGSLSGGEQQMLAIARALMAEPKILLIDEPSQGLAPIVISEIAKNLRNLKKEGVTLIIAEQQLSDIVKIADKAAVLELGQLKYFGPLMDILAGLKELYMG